MNKTMFIAALAALIAPCLSACGVVNRDDLAYAPAAHTPVDPSDAKLTGAIQTFLASHQGPMNSQYEYTRVDLNNDGLREGLVLFNLPHTYWCGWGGCTFAVFEAGDNSFTLLSETSRIRGPLVVGGTQTNGWKDIGVRLSGAANMIADRNVLLQFDGTTYPANPTTAIDGPYDLAAFGGVRVFP